MARPTKDGLEYFPLNTKNDDKFDLIEARHGISGFAIIIKLFQRIYDDKGYFYPWGEKQKLLFSRSISTPIEIIDTIVASAVEFGLFDAERFNSGILTSRGIQRRYFEASKKRKIVNLYSDILLIIPVLGEKQTACRGVFTGNNPQASVLNSGNNPQSKEESKEESSGGNPELIPVITPTVESETTTTFSFSELQEEIKKTTGYIFDSKIISQFKTLNLSPEESSGPHNFFVFVKDVVEAKYPGKSQHEQRTLFISAVTTWENLRSEYPAWRKTRERAREASALEAARARIPEQCQCGSRSLVGKAKNIFVCSACRGTFEFDEKTLAYVFTKQEDIPSAESINNAIRGKKAATISPLPDF